jgi:acyl carrier protein
VYSKIELKVVELVAQSLNLSLDKISIDSSQENTVEWDSLAYLGVLSALEEEFNLSVNQENINNFTSIRNIIREVANGTA